MGAHTLGVDLCTARLAYLQDRERAGGCPQGSPIHPSTRNMRQQWYELNTHLCCATGDGFSLGLTQGQGRGQVPSARMRARHEHRATARPAHPPSKGESQG